MRAAAIVATLPLFVGCATIHTEVRDTEELVRVERKVRVNCVAPGMIDQGQGDGDVLKRFAGSTPMKRNGSADDVVSAVMYFATAPHFVTGQILTVDGGLGLG